MNNDKDLKSWVLSKNPTAELHNYCTVLKLAQENIESNDREEISNGLCDIIDNFLWKVIKKTHLPTTELLEFAKTLADQDTRETFTKLKERLNAQPEETNAKPNKAS